MKNTEQSIAERPDASGSLLKGVAASSDGKSLDEAWQKLEDMGFARLSLPAEAGGDGGTFEEAAALVREAGYRGLALPVAETSLLAGWVLSESGLRVPEGPATVAPVSGEHIEFRSEGGGWTLHGQSRRVPWAGKVRRLVVVGGSEEGVLVGQVKAERCQVSLGENVAGEPRDDVLFEGVHVEGGDVSPVGVPVSPGGLRLRGALARTLSLVGAMDRILDLSVEHAKTRKQFGRALGRFQAVQQQLAVMAGEVAASHAAVDAAVEAVSGKGVGSSWSLVAGAKARTSAAAGRIASIAHQIHGAVGFTERHELRHSTLRLWAWREEFGNDSEWAQMIGQSVAEAGADRLWDAAIDPAAVLKSDLRIEGRGGI